MRKKGILIVKNQNGIWTLQIKRVDGQIVDLDMSKIKSPEMYADYNDKECEYFSRKSQVVVWINDLEIYNAEKEVESPKKSEEKKSAAQLKQEIKDENNAPLTKYENKPLNNKNPQKTLLDSFKLFETNLPKDVRAINIDAKKVDNFYIKLKKAARFIEDKFYFFKNDYKPANKEKNKPESGHKFQIQANFGNIDFTQIANHQKNITELLCGKSNTCETTVGKLDWRLALGLGDASVYETSITLHHIYGIPYIPASAVKGVVRSWIITEVFEVNETKALENPVFQKWFGTTDAGGKIIFFDAFPTSAPTIDVDIMNPHYQPYYSDNANKTAPADYHNPIPVFFLTVKDCAFQFLIGTKEDSDLLKDDKKIGNKTLKQWLEDALQNHGIGAKTAVGYGYMR